jgi:hypothetical protein
MMEEGEELNPGRARYRYLSVMVGQSTQLLSNITPRWLRKLFMNESEVRPKK